jgi:hypothetical protein
MKVQLIERPATKEVRDYKMLIGGQWVDARSGKTFESINPYTGQVWAPPLKRTKRTWMRRCVPLARPSTRGRGAR